MTLDEIDNKLNSHAEINYFLFGYKVEDGIYRFDAVGCISREDARKEAKKFTKYTLYDLTKSKNQNL